MVIQFEETVSSLHRNKYYSVFDCYSGLWQIRYLKKKK